MLSSRDSLTFAPFKRRQSPRSGLVCLLAAWLAGCATSQVQTQPGTQAVIQPSASAVAPTPRIDLTEEMLYKLLVAEIAGQRGHPEMAVENYLDIARTVADARVAERATRIAIFAKREHDALEAAELWVARAGDDPEARRVLAALLIREGRLDEALKHLEIATDSDDEQASHNLRLIANLLSTGKDQAAALEVMERLVAKRQDDPQALFAYAWLALRAGKVQVARETMERALRLPPFDTNMAVAYLGILQKQGDVQTALTWIEEAVKEHPEDFHLRMAYGRLLADNKHFDAARDQFEILAKEQPDNPDVRFALGLLYLQGQDLAKAEQSFMRIARSGQYTQDARYYLGQIAEAKKDYGSALRWYASVEEGPNHFDAQLSIALALVKDGKVKDAERHLATINPSNEQQRIKAIRIAGEILSHQGRYTEAMKLYDQALAGGYDSELLYTRAMLADKIGRIDLLERDLKHILAREPKNAQALNALGFSLADRTTRYQEAYALIKRALELTPNDFFVLDSMGWVLYRLGRLDEAESYLRRALQIRNDPEVAAHLGEILWVKGDRAEARRVWDGALRVAPGDPSLLKVMRRLNQ